MQSFRKALNTFDDILSIHQTIILKDRKGSFPYFLYFTKFDVKIMLPLLSTRAACSHVCELFSYDADTCLSVFGCGYCLTTQKCIAYNNPPYQEVDECVNSGQFIKMSNGDLGKCFYLFSDDNCAQCVSTTTHGSCGWCESTGICMEGNKTGPFSQNCLAKDWIYNKRKCSKSICASSKNSDTCIHPCKWNQKRQVCFMPRDLNVDTVEEKHLNLQVFISNNIFIIAITLLIAVAIGVGIIICDRAKKPLGGDLSVLENISLEDLPPMRSY